MSGIGRREFVALLGGAAVAWPVVARAQQPAMPVVGFLAISSRDTYGYLVDAFRQGLRESGYVEGRNVAIEYRWGDNRLDRLPTLAADLVGRQVAVIAAVGGVSSPRAAKAATSTIPIVFTMGSDPVSLGLVASLNRPGGNATGMTLLSGPLLVKRVELARELLPTTDLLAVLTNPTNPENDDDLKYVQEAVRSAPASSTAWRGRAAARSYVPQAFGVFPSQPSRPDSPRSPFLPDGPRGPTIVSPDLPRAANISQPLPGHGPGSSRFAMKLVPLSQTTISSRA